MATATMATPSRFGRKPVAALGKLTIVALIGAALALVYLQVMIIGEMIPPLVVFASLGVIFAGLVAMGYRWTPLLGTLFSVVLFAMNAEPMITALMNPADFNMFTFMMLTLTALVIGIVAGIAATVQNYRHATNDRTTPRSLKATLIALVAIIAGALLVAAIPQKGVVAGISPETLQALPVLATKNFAFSQKELRVKAGETVALRLTNGDAESHYLDIDELGVDAPILPGKTGLAVFKPTKAGTYTFYCRPHSNKATGEGMIGKLIVEP